MRCMKIYFTKNKLENYKVLREGGKNINNGIFTPPPHSTTSLNERSALKLCLLDYF